MVLILVMCFFTFQINSFHSVIFCLKKEQRSVCFSIENQCYVSNFNVPLKLGSKTKHVRMFGR